MASSSTTRGSNINYEGTTSNNNDIKEGMNLTSNNNDISEVQQVREKYFKERRKYLEIYLQLYKASIRCDWKAAAAILDKNRGMNLLRQSITENGETALHIAASAKGPKKVDEFVRNLVGKMEAKDLELVNKKHKTALYSAAAIGNIETTKIMMEKNPSLDTIPGGRGRMMPLYAAVLYGHKDVAKYLFECSEDLGKGGWNDENRSSLLEKCVESDMFDIAIKILMKYPKLGRDSNLLGLLARKPEAFLEKKSNIIKRTIKSVSDKVGTPVKKSDALSLLRILWEDIVNLPRWKMDNILKGPPDLIQKPTSSGRIVQTIQLKQLIVYHLDKLVAETQTLGKGTLAVQNLKDIVSNHVVNLHVETQSLIKQENTTDEDQALDLQKIISEYIVKLHDATKKIPTIKSDCQQAQKILTPIFKEISKMRAEAMITDIREIRDTRTRYSSRVMFIAAEVGNTNFLVELISGHPDLIWKVNDNNQTIFHIAAKHRHESICNLLYEIGSMKDMVTPLKDNDGNNMLHLAAMSTRKKNLTLAALQMQEELLWFREVERMIPPSSRVSKNKDGFTPRELFTMEHQDLVEQGEESLKSIANQCMVVATLVATIVFAAAFTVPGGYNQNDGIPMFNRKLSFAVFVVADAMSLFFSSASILIFTSFFISSGYTERDFEASLPMKLMSGLRTLFYSIWTMLVTFIASFFVLYDKEMKWIPIFVSLFAVIPLILYVALQNHLLGDVAIPSTYGRKYLWKPNKHVLFYENPRF